MAQAFALARRGLGTTWPNPSVGCVVVGGFRRIVGRGVTRTWRTPHAEAVTPTGPALPLPTQPLLCDALSHVPMRAGEPPAPTPFACRAAPSACRRSAMDDPDPRTASHGAARLRAAGIEVTEGVLQMKPAR